MDKEHIMTLLVAFTACVITQIAGVNIIRNIKKKNYIRALAIVAGLAILYLSGFYLFLFFITSM